MIALSTDNHLITIYEKKKFGCDIGNVIQSFYSVDIEISPIKTEISKTSSKISIFSETKYGNFLVTLTTTEPTNLKGFLKRTLL